jgi:hypothetical protein
MWNEVSCKVAAWNLTCFVRAIYDMGGAAVFWPDQDHDEPWDMVRFLAVV